MHSDSNVVFPSYMYVCVIKTILWHFVDAFDTMCMGNMSHLYILDASTSSIFSARLHYPVNVTSEMILLSMNESSSNIK